MKFGPARLLAGAPSGDEVRIADGRRVAVAGAGGPGLRVGLADAGHRPPELVEVLRLPDRDARVGHGDVHEREQPRELDAPSCRARARSAPRSGCTGAAARTGSACRRRPSRSRSGAAARVRTVGVVTPSPPRRFTSSNAAAYSGLVIAGGGGTRNWPRRPEHERRHLAPVRAERERDLADRVLAPMARLVARDVVDADPRLGVLRAVVRPQREDRRRGAPPELDALRSSRVRRCGSRAGPRRAAASKLAACDGNSATSVSCAACAIAASIEASSGAGAETGVARGSRRRSRSPRRTSRCGRSPSRGSSGPGRAARRTRGSRRAAPGCGRGRSRRSRSGSSAAGARAYRRRAAADGGGRRRGAAAPPRSAARARRGARAGSLPPTRSSRAWRGRQEPRPPPALPASQRPQEREQRFLVGVREPLVALGHLGRLAAMAADRVVQRHRAAVVHQPGADAHAP